MPPTTQGTEKNPLLPGYEITGLIGSGGIGTVHEARDAQGRRFALKTMRTTPFIGEKYLAHIIENAELIGKYSSRPEYRLVKIIETGRRDDFFYVVMDFYEKGSLERKIHDDGWSFDERLDFTATLAETLAKIHSIGLVHGDLKPANIMIGRDGGPYLNDFYQAAENTFGGKTYSGISGTPLYMSPEQLAGKFLNKGTDIYSFGIIACEILTRKMPYPIEKTTGFSHISSTIHSGNTIHPQKLSPMIGSRLDAILMSALKTDPAERCQDMDAIAPDLRNIRAKKASKGIISNIFRNIFRPF